MQTASIRALVESVSSEMTALSVGPTDLHRGSLDPLAEAWEHLVDALALPPEPTRVCPVCGHLGMSLATVCGYCWTKFDSA